MFKLKLAFILALLVAINSINVHLADIDINKLTDDQKNVDNIIRQRVGKLNGVTLSAGEQNGNDFTFRYIGTDIPITFTDVKATKNGTQYYIKGAVSSSTVPLENGNRLTKKTTVNAGGNFNDAKKAFGW